MRGIVTSSAFKDHADRLAAEVAESRGPISLVCKDPAVSARLFELSRNGIADAVAVEVPRAVDQVERVLLSIGAGLGPDPSRRLSEMLEKSGASLAPALSVLDKAMDERGGTLVVRGWDVIGDVGGGDTEIRRAVKDRTDELRKWMAGKRALFLLNSSMGAPVGRTLEPLQLHQAPAHLYWQEVQDADSLWSRSGRDSTVYDLRMAQLALEEDSDGTGSEKDDLVGPDTPLAILSRLGPQTTRLLRALALHGRPMRRAVLKGDVFCALDGEIELGVALGLWFPVGDQLLVHPGWQSWCLNDVHERDRRHLHRNLAQAFAAQVRPEDPHAGRWGLSILEAHRHFVAANDLPQALRYARYGTALLIERARVVSLNAEESREFEQAAELYGRALDLQQRQPDSDPASLRAYAVHYWHFNRAKAGLETIEQTTEGYRQSVDMWPAQALFWSRYIRSLFIGGRRAEAMQALADAKRQVPPHRDKDATLIRRTVDRLLDRLDRRPDLMLDVIEVWDGHRPGDQTEEVAHKLEARLGAGWRTTSLEPTDGAAIWFNREVLVRVLSITDGTWQAEVEEAQFRRRGSSPLAALHMLISALRARCAELLAAYTHTLDARTRLEKQNLLGCVDVVRSGLDAKGPDAVWMMGTLRLDEDGALALHTHGSRHLIFTLPSELAADKVASDQLWRARVRAGSSGVPTGPILALKPAYEDEDAIVDRWNRRFAHGG